MAYQTRSSQTKRYPKTFFIECVRIRLENRLTNGDYYFLTSYAFLYPFALNLRRTQFHFFSLTTIHFIFSLTHLSIISFYSSFLTFYLFFNPQSPLSLPPIHSYLLLPSRFFTPVLFIHIYSFLHVLFHTSFIPSYVLFPSHSLSL